MDNVGLDYLRMLTSLSGPERVALMQNRPFDDENEATMDGGGDTVRIGRFFVGGINHGFGGSECRPDLLAIFGRCVIIRCEYNFALNAMEYIAYSPDFEPVEKRPISFVDLSTIPHYEWWIHTKPDGSFTVEARRYAIDSVQAARTAKLLGEVMAEVRAKRSKPGELVVLPDGMAIEPARPRPFVRKAVAGMVEAMNGALEATAASVATGPKSVPADPFSKDWAAEDAEAVDSTMAGDECKQFVPAKPPTFTNLAEAERECWQEMKTWTESRVTIPASVTAKMEVGKSYFIDPGSGEVRDEEYRLMEADAESEPRKINFREWT